MCTLSFLPSAQAHGFHLLMNRDEQRSRPRALPPALQTCGSRQALYPRESGGGTWIGINESSLTMALLNWYSQPQKTADALISRGTLIPALLSSGTLREAEEHLLNQPLTHIQPFRLIMISPKESLVLEEAFDGHFLERKEHAWERTHWFSSGYDEPRASKNRATCCAAIADNLSGSKVLARLRELHSSHLPEKGPFSICMHREDAQTVSMTEISVTESLASMRYHDGPPCKSLHDPAVEKNLAICVKSHRNS